MKTSSIPNTAETKTLKQMRRLGRKSKTEVLRLHPESALPMFAHNLSAEEIRSHPQINSWHMHRQAMENQILDRLQLPPHFQSSRGQFRSLNKKRGNPVQTGEKTIRATKKVASQQTKQKERKENTSYAKMRILKLGRKSAIPAFAHKLSNKEVEDHKDISTWHEYREMVESGTMRQQELPLQFQSKVPGELFFRSPEALLKETEPTSDSLESGQKLPVKGKRVRSEKDLQQDNERKAKLRALQLSLKSAIPIFAQKLSAQEVQRSDQIQEWHRYRRMIEKGDMSEKDLPDHFKGRMGTLRFRKPLKAAQQPKQAFHLTAAEPSGSDHQHHIQKGMFHRQKRA
jgi:hypothetical protein